MVGVVIMGIAGPMNFICGDSSPMDGIEIKLIV